MSASVIWDIIMDWSLGDISAPYPLLRKNLAYRQTWFYYAAILLDPPLRCTWILFAVFPHHAESSAFMTFLIALGEVLRRIMWALLRVENEHCTNVSRARAMRDLQLPYKIPSPTKEPLIDTKDHQSGSESEGNTDSDQSSGSRRFSRQASANLPKIRTDVPNHSHMNVDVERQNYYHSPGGTFRQLRDTLCSSPFLTHMGHILQGAHAEDFERSNRIQNAEDMNSIAEHSGGDLGTRRNHRRNHSLHGQRMFGR
jgi:xenotropic and polytropic retrovirus receptor 1